MKIAESRWLPVWLVLAIVLLALSSCYGVEVDSVSIENRTNEPLRIFFSGQLLHGPGSERPESIAPGEETSIGVDPEASWPARIEALAEDGTVFFDMVFTREQASELDFRIAITAK